MKKLIIGLAGGLVLTMATAAWAQHGCGMSSSGHDHGAKGSSGHDHESKADAAGHSQAQVETHGGCSAKTRAYHFEVVYLAEGIRVYAYDARQKPISTQGIEGVVTLAHKNGGTETLATEFVGAQPLGEEPGRVTYDYLFAAHDLSKAKPAAFEAWFTLSKLPQSGETEAAFRQTFAGVTRRPFMCPMHADVWGETDQSKCYLCGMKTTDRRPEMYASRQPEPELEPEQEHTAGHVQGD